MRASPAILATFLAAMISGSVCAGPLVIEETARILPPEAGYGFSGDVAIDGNTAIVVGGRPYGEPLEDYSDIAAFLFERNAAGTWTFVRKLVERTQVFAPESSMAVAIRAGVAAVSSDGLHVFERTAAGWVEATASGAPNGTDLEIDGGTILASNFNCGWKAEPYRKAPNGAWTPFGQITGVALPCQAGIRGGDVDISGNRAILMNELLGQVPVSEARIYEVGAAPPWVHVATLTSPVSEINSRFGPLLALRNGIAVVAGTPIGPEGSFPPGTYVFERNSGGVWNLASRVQWPDGMFDSARALHLRDNWLLQGQWTQDLAIDTIGVYQRQSNGTFKYLAKLIPGRRGPSPESLLNSVGISGRTVIASGTDAAHIYDLPASFAQPAVQQEDFQVGNAPRWTPLAGSSFAVAGSGIARVYRQSSVAGNAASLLGNTSWQNQAIEADVRPTAFSGADRWVGLVVRYADAGNYYYVTLRSSNVIELRRIVNGQFITLGTAPLPVTLNKNYRLRLQAIGTYIKVYVDGVAVPQLEVSDAELRQGQAGVMMYRARADYDNVVVSPNPHTRVFNTGFGGGSGTYPWVTTGRWTLEREGDLFATIVFRQSDLSGGARAVTGVAIDDQIVSVTTRPLAFSGNDRWFGVVARYRDDGNYYYVTLRNSNVIALRKLVNGVIHDIATAPLSVAVGTTYKLRLEAVGTSLRAYVNGVLVLQGTDTSHSVGTYGMAMYKASVTYDDFLAYQP